MTNETNAALSALKDAYEVLDTGGARHVIGVDRATKLVKRFGEAIRFFEASQREAPVAEGVSEEEAKELFAEFWNRVKIERWRNARREETLYTGWMQCYAALSARLADRPSVTNVTNVSREGVAAILYEHKFGNDIGYLGKEECDELAIPLSSAIQLQLPAPGKAADEGVTSPTNACIRAAKRVIAALNMAEGAGVAFAQNGCWFVFEAKPILDTSLLSSWNPKTGGRWLLPDTAIPLWPGDFRESWITARTEEVTE